jgi:hypothetical protein
MLWGGYLETPRIGIEPFAGFLKFMRLWSFALFLSAELRGTEDATPLEFWSVETYVRLTVTVG